MEGTLQFCGDVSGFENATRDSEEFTSISRDRDAIYLSQGDRGLGVAWVWIGVEDVEKRSMRNTKLADLIQVRDVSYSSGSDYLGEAYP